MNNKIHQVPLSQDLETVSDTEAEELALADETARLSRPLENELAEDYYGLTEEELADLERPDNGQMKLEDWYHEPLWSEVLPNLWQGGTAGNDEIIYGTPDPNARITKADFDTVITMYAYAQAADWHVRELRYGIYDSDMKDFDYEELFELVRSAHKDWLKGKKVLIRCQAGWNRSGLITALVLIRHGMPAQEAIDLIRQTRSPHALCNDDFVGFLLKQEAEHWQGDEFGSPEPEVKN
jgi:protein-tyrosine phosphatase